MCLSNEGSGKEHTHNHHEERFFDDILGHFNGANKNTYCCCLALRCLNSSGIYTYEQNS